MNHQYIELLKNIFQLVLAAISLLTIVATAILSRGARRDVTEKIRKSNLDVAFKDEIQRSMARWKLTARASWSILAVMVILILGSIGWRMLYPPDRADLSRYLSDYDPTIFGDRKEILAEIARVFPDRQSLSKEADLGSIIRGANRSFDLLAEHGSSVVVDYNAEIMDAVKRGVNFRVLVYDPDTLMTGKHDELVNMITRGRQGLAARSKQNIDTMKRMQDEIARDKTSFRGSLVFRTLKKPLLYRMWIREGAGMNETVAHVSIHQYRGNEHSPSFRASGKTSERLIKNLIADFELIWRDSR